MCLKYVYIGMYKISAYKETMCMWIYVYVCMYVCMYMCI